MKYRFITNFKEEELRNIYVAIRANEIKDFTFCKTAKNKRGDILPGFFALYFGENITEKEIEMFYRTLLFIHFHATKEEGPDDTRYIKRDHTP